MLTTRANPRCQRRSKTSPPVPAPTTIEERPGRVLKEKGSS